MVAKRKPTKGSKETMGQRLARLRQMRGLTQVELAEKIGLSQPNVSEYERDTFRPNSDTLLCIAQVLKVSTDELLGHHIKAAKTPKIHRTLMRRVVAIQQLPKRDQQTLLRTIDTFLKGAQT